MPGCRVTSVSRVTVPTAMHSTIIASSMSGVRSRWTIRMPMSGSQIDANGGPSAPRLLASFT